MFEISGQSGGTGDGKAITRRGRFIYTRSDKQEWEPTAKEMVLGAFSALTLAALVTYAGYLKYGY